MSLQPSPRRPYCQSIRFPPAPQCSQTPRRTHQPSLRSRCLRHGSPHIQPQAPQHSPRYRLPTALPLHHAPGRHTRGFSRSPPHHHVSDRQRRGSSLSLWLAARRRQPPRPTHRSLRMLPRTRSSPPDFSTQRMLPQPEQHVHTHPHKPRHPLRSSPIGLACGIRFVQPSGGSPWCSAPLAAWRQHGTSYHSYRRVRPPYRVRSQ